MGLAILAGMLAYRKLPTFYRILFLQVALFIVFDLYGTTIPYNNVVVYNISILIEINLFFIAAYIYFNTIISKRIIFTMSFLFLSLFLFDIWSFGVHALARHAYIAGGIIITGIYITILSFHFLKRNDKYETLPLVLASVGTIIYFAGMVPYISMMDYFQKQDPESNKELFRTIILTLGILRYLLLSAAFLILWKPPRPKGLNMIAND